MIYIKRNIIVSHIGEHNAKIDADFIINTKYNELIKYPWENDSGAVVKFVDLASLLNMIRSYYFGLGYGTYEYVIYPHFCTMSSAVLYFTNAMIQSFDKSKEVV